MGKIFSIISKNLKILMRSKVSSLIIIFGPLFLTLFVGLAFSNTGLSSIRVGVYAPTYNGLVESFVNKTIQAKLTVIRFDTDLACQDSIKYGTVNLCMIFPANFEIAKGNSSVANNLITFYVDPTQLNLVYGVIDLISSQVESRKQELSTELTTVLLTTLDNTKRKIISDGPLFIDIAKSSEVINNRREGITSKLSGLDLNFNTNKFGMDQLTEVRSVLIQPSVNQNITMKTRLNQSLALVEQMLSNPEVNGTGIGTTLTTLRTKLRTLYADAVNIDTLAIPELEQAITLITNSVEDTSTKFATLKSNRDSIVNSDLKEISDSVDSILTNILKIKGDMDSIKQEIDSIQVKETSSIVSPIRTTIKPLVSETYLNYMFPSLITLVVMLVTLLFAQTIVMIERKSPAYFRNIVTPTKDNVFLISNFLTTMLLLMLQLLLILGVSMLVFRVDILANLFPTMLVLTLIVTLFTICGIIIGTVFSSPETATLGAISIGSIGLFLSDVLLPLESMPPYIQAIARFNPFVVGEHLLRNTIIFKSSFGTIFTSGYATGQVPAIFLLLIYIIMMTIVLVISNDLSKRILIQRKTAPKKLKKGQVPVSTSELAGDPVEKTETLVKTAFELIKDGEFAKASMVYVHLNELYAHLPKERKKLYFKKIIQIHQLLERAEKEKSRKVDKK
jgi:ABC-type multidrug transport system permease subunit